MREYELSYPNGPRIHRGLTEAALKEFIGQMDVGVRDVGTGWVWYRLPTFLDGKLAIGVELGFNQGSLEQLTVFHDDPVIYGSGWERWSEENERLRAETTRSWLQARGFQIGRYAWGEIWSDYDARSGFGSGGIRYAP